MTVNVTHFHRRLVVLAFVLGYLGILSVRLFAADLGVLGIALQLIGPITAGFLLAWGIPRLKEDQLDERQREVRNDAYFRTYLTLAFVTISAPVLFILLLLTAEATARTLLASLLAALERPVDFVTTLGALATFVVFLPWAMLAWLEPDPLPDERDPAVEAA